MTLRVALLASLLAVAAPPPLRAGECSGVCDGRPCTTATGAGGNCLIQPLGACACVPEVTPTRTPPPIDQCVGDCNGDGQVRINELITGIDIALGVSPLAVCPAFDCPDLASITCTLAAVSNALAGCRAATPTATPTMPPTPALSLAVQVVPHPGETRLDIVATIEHLGGPVVSYRAGCSALCRPARYQPVSFVVTGSDGQEVIVDFPCIGPLFCAEYVESLPPGSSRTQTFAVTGIAWTWDDTSPLFCIDCEQIPLAAGHYVVVARFSYRIGDELSDPAGPDITATAAFDWPPAP